MLHTISRAAVLAAVSALLIPSAFAAKICIDPGHGGSDSGAVGGTQTEKANVLNTGLKFRTWLNTDTNDGGGGGSWSVIMTRSTDVFVELDGRTAYANNNAADRFMSIHNNACGSCGASGTETYSYTSGSSTSHDLRNKVQYRSVQAWGLSNRGNKTANFYVIKYTNMPAELAELGFIDSANDRTYLGGSTHQDNMAKHHLYAIQTHYGLTAYTPSSGPAPVTYTDDSPACSANWSTGTSAADKYGADYRFRPTEAISDAASWSATVANAGSYDISAWWTAGTNRSASAPYVLPGSVTVNVNQQANGGKWNLLGTRSLAAGANTVSLSCWAADGFVVVADAVKFYGPK